ncbi:MAG TPA: 3'-5' exonuclease [Candidatus Nitrosotalea sp.]|nr:3'-5' exonuclease [Candidatus Nitrosotalea sp.]
MPLEAGAGDGAFRKLIALELSPAQRSAVEAPYEHSFAILGRGATGKSVALAERAARARALHPDAEPIVLGSPLELEAYAFELLRSRGTPATTIDDVEAELLFAEACAPLFELRWEEFVRDQLDPEVPGLRTPERFLASAFRLIRRLRDGGIEPSEFLTRSLTGATEFYAKPPNFADPGLLGGTKNTHHDSLYVTPGELSHQRSRELDLAKILAKLYERYVELAGMSGRMTGRDAVVAATKLLRDDPAFAAMTRARHRVAFVDDAQELTGAQIALLKAIFGTSLDGVTFCGDSFSSLSVIRVTQPHATFALAQSSVELTESYRSPHIETQRVAAPSDEAELIAERVGEWLAQGHHPEKIAVLFRSVRSVESYEAALLERNIPVSVSGDVNVFGDRRALDAIALLWNVYDPFRHDWLLRTLANPALGLSDAALAILCGDPPNPQRPLFEFDDEPAPTVRASRWNPKRDLRLGWNVIRGERDEELSDEAAARLRRFRASRERWQRVMHEVSFDDFARLVWSEGLAREGDAGSARARAQQLVLQRLLGRLIAYAREHSDASVGDVLAYADRRIESDLESCTSTPLGASSECVQLLSVEAARGREFEHVVVANARPGAFPRWYVPEAFLFSRRLGMVPKENAGEARAARTAKFTYYLYRSKAAQHYYERERRAFEYALRRARKSAFVTASGPPTRGVSAPEFLEELR